MIKNLKLNLFCIFNFLFFIPSMASVDTASNDVIIKAGTSKVTGRITSANQEDPSSIAVNMTISLPISGEYVKHQAQVDKSGQFSIDVNLETDISLISLSTSVNPEHSLVVKLISGSTTNLNLSYGLDNGIKHIEVSPAMNKDDMMQGFATMNKMFAHRSGRAQEPLYSKSTDYFLNYAKTIVDERLMIVKEDKLLSPALKQLLERDFRLFMYTTHVFDYEGEMLLNYRNVSRDENNKPDLQKIDRSYFSFLKNFNLDDSQYLQCFTFLEFQKQILQNETLGIPMIGDMDISTWLKSVKVILADLVGFEKGAYYDILAANAYARQLTEEVRPLTEKQKKHINAYWKNGEITKILMRKNQQVVDFAKSKSPTVVNEISSVAKEKVMDTIISKYKNKVVFVDLWATWCAPCLDAMQQFRATKDGLRDKDVAFVYLTNGSSPKKLWEEKIQGIGSEHYYLTAAQWEYIMETYDFEAIPSYILFDKDGKLVNKFTGFPGSDRVGELINGLL
jgi:thiol-disulfide isomerase/thioredoxin